MDVKCERCNTEYEFDDALVSGRGTTVKCTNCGHKFKIRRSDGDFSEDFWNVTTGDGRTLVFTSLRELQKAIQGYLVERNDRLSRGGLPPKAIGGIPELASFFEQREAAKKSQQSGRTVKTQDGLGPEARELVGSHNQGARPRQATRPEFPAPPAEGSSTGKSTLIGTGPVSEQEAIPSSSDPHAGVASSEPAAAPIAVPTAPRVPSAPPAAPAPTVESPPAPAPAVAARAERSALPPVVSAPPAPAVSVAPAPLTPAARPLPPPPVPKRETVKQASAPPPPVVAARATPAPATASLPPPLPDRARRSTEPLEAPSKPPPAPRAAARSGDSHPPPPARAERSGAGGGAASRTASNGRSGHDVSVPPAPRRVRTLREELEEDDRRGEPASLPEGPASRRRPVGGFTIAAVVVGGLLMLSAVWAHKNLGITLGAKPPPAPAPAVDPRVAAFLANGERALGDGNLELAKESFDKASALAERDPHVLLGLARLAAVRADVLWLKTRLLAPEAAEEQRITRDGLNELSASARRAAEDALLLAPDDPAALRAKIDALRISGDRDGARGLAFRITASATSPETAYVLAALDLAETEPLWPTVIERLRAASSAETGPGRARATLVYSLVRAGDVAGAKAEVDRLTAMPRAHPLLPLLRGLTDRAVKAKADGGAPAAEIASAPAAPAAPTKGGKAAGGGGGAGGGGSGDARDLVAQGEKARGKGDYDRAKTLFSSAVEKNPNDSEALAGLGSVAYAQRDMSSARSSFKRVLAINPNYMPALVGLADVEWDSGDKAAATKMYKDIVDRYPEGAYPGRVKQRSEGGG